MAVLLSFELFCFTRKIIEIPEKEAQKDFSGDEKLGVEKK